MKLKKTEGGFFFVYDATEEENTFRDFVEKKHKLIYQIQIDESGFNLIELGEKEDACNLSLNITFSSEEEQIQLISNLGHTPFFLDDITYQSVEAFWQSLKFKEEKTRLEIAEMHGKAAKKIGSKAEYEEFVEYKGSKVRVGSPDHWSLMEMACTEKFNQNIPAQKALLETGIRPLYHKPRRDSKTIPGPIMSGIWMNVRSRLRREMDMQSQVLSNLI
jgi:predicted NAD-dependent protein-ADP-ribosyltransferase YbiA (DUF1768 family)